jgi:hypothetical protein
LASFKIRDTPDILVTRRSKEKCKQTLCQKQQYNMTKVKISSNWTALKPLEECVKVQTVQEFQDFDPEDIDPSHCIQVERSPPLPENDQDSCQISVTLLDPDLVISRLVLASQCKRLEIHEGCIPQVGPYIQTITGSILGTCKGRFGGF